ncbi:MAG: YajD family HNH nuclease [Gammaproteobacteria bacterium]
MNRYKPKPANPANKVDQLIEQTHRNRVERERGYRAQALKMYPWICGRCEREFTHSNLRELTVHHRDHNHDNNPPDGSNWELLCLYCHDNEHARFIDAQWGGSSTPASPDQETVTHKPFEALADLLKRKE